MMLWHRGVGDGELAWRCQQTAAEGAGVRACSGARVTTDLQISAFDYCNC